jgi:hypothetical protein
LIESRSMLPDVATANAASTAVVMATPCKHSKMFVIGWLRPLLVALSVIHAATGATVNAAVQEATPVKREILALYDGEQEGNADATRIHRFAELPLNHLGYILRFHDVRTKLPDPASIDRYRGILTWFAGPIRDGPSYLAWASRVSRANVHFVILGDIGIAADASNLLAVNRVLGLAGLRHTGDYVARTLSTRVVQKDPSLVEFECQLGVPWPDYPIVNVAAAGIRIGLTLESPAHDGRRSTVLVAIGDKGGYAALNYEFCHQRPPLYQGKWLINPFAFFDAAFGVSDFPIPDTTTLSGRRTYFSRLQSDGWTRLSKVDGFRDTGTMAADVVLRELIEPFHDLPTTITLRENAFPGFGRTAGQARGIVQRVLATRNVDPSRRPLQTTPSRFDSNHPSISNLSPLRSADAEQVVNAPMGDETAYSSAGPVGESGFFALKETVANTETPRRLKPFNPNYHAYAGEYPALLQSVKALLQEASAAALAPISANRFAAIVEGFFTAQIDRVGHAAWRISNRGALQTVRLDAADGRDVDFRSSRGVIGQRRNGNTLYIALDEAIEPAIVVLTSRPLAYAAAPGALVLIEGRWRVRNVVANGGCALTFETQGYGRGAFSWSGAALGHYAITAQRGGAEVWRQTAQATTTGTLDFVLDVSAIDPIAVRINCGEVAHSAGR